MAELGIMLSDEQINEIAVKAAQIVNQSIVSQIHEVQNTYAQVWIKLGKFMAEHPDAIDKSQALIDTVKRIENTNPNMALDAMLDMAYGEINAN